MNEEAVISNYDTGVLHSSLPVFLKTITSFLGMTNSKLQNKPAHTKG